MPAETREARIYSHFVSFERLETDLNSGMPNFERRMKIGKIVFEKHVIHRIPSQYSLS